MSAQRTPGTPVRPPRRRVVAAYLLLALLGIAALVALGEALRHQHPLVDGEESIALAGPDLMREDVECPSDRAREGIPDPAAPIEDGTPRLVTSNQLYDCPRSWDRRLVRYVGEVVGEPLDRGDTVWVQLNDDIYSGDRGQLPTHSDFRGGNAGVGARLRAEHAGMVVMSGGRRTQGTVVQVDATFHRVEPGSGEVAVLEVHALQVLDEGGVVEQPTVPARRVVALVAAAGALALVIAERRKRLAR